MITEQVDAYLAGGDLTLPASPEWREGNRAGERRCSLPVALNGSVGTMSLEITVKLTDPAYLMVLLLAPGGKVVCRLCMTTGHRDRATGDVINEAHFHSWEANRRPGKAIPKQLVKAELVPPEIRSRDDAFTWFLTRTNISIPPWCPMAWPHGQGLL